MKSKFIILISVLFATTVFAQVERKYFFVKSGHVEYKLGGNTTGTKSLWFDNYGMLMYTLTESSTTVKLLGLKNTTNKKELEIRRGNEVWRVDLLNNTGVKISVASQVEVGEKLTEAKTDAQLHELERKLLKDMGAEIEGYETFLGKNCLKFVWGTTNFLQYKGIVLQSNVSILAVTYSEIATSIETEIVVSASKFEIPNGVQFEDMGSIMNDLENEI